MTDGPSRKSSRWLPRLIGLAIPVGLALAGGALLALSSLKAPKQIPAESVNRLSKDIQSVPYPSRGAEQDSGSVSGRKRSDGEMSPVTEKRR